VIFLIEECTDKLITDGTDVYSIGGDNDAGVDINAFFEFPLSDFGIDNIKKIRSFYLSYTADQELILRQYDADGNYKHSYLRTSGNKYKAIKVSGHADFNSRYFKVRISNTAGGDFSFDDIKMYIISLSKKEQ